MDHHADDGGHVPAVTRPGPRNQTTDPNAAQANPAAPTVLDTTGYLVADENLADVTDPAEARVNLCLGDSATKSVGTTAGTIAAGDDSRITGSAQKTANLSDLANPGAARTNLGLGDAATKATGTGQGQVPVLDANGAVPSAVAADSTKPVLNAAMTATSASAGSASALPLLPAGYVVVTIGGTARKVPFYA